MYSLLRLLRPTLIFLSACISCLPCGHVRSVRAENPVLSRARSLLVPAARSVERMSRALIATPLSKVDSAAGT